jgi:hypothetical protein
VQELGPRCRGSSSRTRPTRPLAREIADLRIVPVDDEHAPRPAAHDRASARRRAPARRSGRAGRETGSRGRRPRPHALAISGSAASSTSNSPSSGAFADRRLEVTPESRFAPTRCARAAPRAQDLRGHRRVVVLPFVAETSAEPSGSASQGGRAPRDRSTPTPCRAPSSHHPLRRDAKAVRPLGRRRSQPSGAPELSRREGTPAGGHH